uniref:NADH-ubiquinone oxidoreductase chain 6 n=1 Tax=Enicmus brevicornis TaxID=346775 RepID=S4SUW7_9CUCU|nr:NADH dehydrogenase subunit 6 [Enicmus brevicornis]
MTINIILSFSFLFMKHPLSMGMTLLAQTITIALLMGFFSMNYWYSYILTLIMIGGMLILFIYMTSIASNEKFKLNFKLMILNLSICLILLYLLISNLNITLMEFSDTKMITSKIDYSMMNYYNYPKNFIMLMIIIYLFITLITVVKISKTNQGPLRQMF